MASIKLVAVILASFFYFTEGKVVGSCRGAPNFARCTRLPGPMKLQPVCYQEKCIVPDAFHNEYTIVAKYAPSEEISSTFAVSEMWIRGSGPRMNWDVPVRLNRTDVYTWKITLQYTSDPLAAICTKSEHCSFLQQAVEFRLYLDEQGSKGMQGANFYHHLPLSASLRHPDMSEIRVYPWFRAAAPKISEPLPIKDLNFFPTAMKKRVPHIHYPPSFHENTLKKYRIVINMMHIQYNYSTVQEMFNYLMAAEGSLDELIVVSITHADDLVPYLAPNYKCRSNENNCEGTCLNCLDPQRLERCAPHIFRQQLKSCTVNEARGLVGDDYISFLENSLLPALVDKWRGRLLLDFSKHKMTIMGYRHAGLFACYAGLKRPNLFQNVACLSPAFYLGIENYSPRFEFQAYLSELVNQVASDAQRKDLYQTQKYYMDIGEMDDFYFPLYTARDSVEDVVSELEKLGINKDEQILVQIFPNHSAYRNTFNTGTSNDWPYFQRMLYALLSFHKPQGGGSRYTNAIKIDQPHFVDWEIQLNRLLSGYTLGEAELDSKPTERAKATAKPSANNATADECSAIVISTPTYLGSVSAAVIVSSVTAGLLFYIREANQKLGKKKDATKEEIDLDDLESDSESD